jgi:DNA-binding transcriptional ArsR family regulator
MQWFDVRQTISGVEVDTEADASKETWMTDVDAANAHYADFPIPAMADVELIDVLRALGDPIRLAMVRRLADGEPRPKAEVMQGFEVQKSTVSHHFKTLREAGLLQWTVEGRTHQARLRRAELDERFPGLIASLLAG